MSKQAYDNATEEEKQAVDELFNVLEKHFGRDCLKGRSAAMYLLEDGAKEVCAKWGEENPRKYQLANQVLLSMAKRTKFDRDDFYPGLPMDAFTNIQETLKKRDIISDMLEFVHNTKPCQAYSKQSVDLLKNTINDCQIFMVDMMQFDTMKDGGADGDYIKNIRTLKTTLDTIDDEIDDEIDMPFKSCLILDLAKRPLSVLNYLDNDHNITHSSTSIIALYVVEKSPKEYDVWTYELHIKSFTTHCVVDAHWGLKNNNYVFCKKIIHDFLDLLNNSDIAVDSSETRVKIQNPSKGKRFQKFKNVMFVNRKKSKFSGDKKGLTWQVSHRFDVCGHWAMLPNLKNPEFDKDGNKLPDMTRIGKDRSGNYCVNGYTWRNPHVKGSEDLPYVKKTRVVK